MAELIKDKTSEEQKFSAIFNWVALNIRYDYNVYFSSTGVGESELNRILKSKKGVCVDYAFLMDTLCRLAGIENTTIYGYAKDEIFDVNDSIYIDNHAWNAVKLDGSWYVYDVTWAAGSVVYDFTRWSKFLIRIFKKVKPKFKKVRLNQRLKISDCGVFKSPPAYVYRQRFLNFILMRSLGVFRLKIKETYLREINLDYYLSDPETFFVTHLPDHAAWTLLPGKTMREFETDSAFYHLETAKPEKKKAEGVECSDCDNSYNLPSRERYLLLKKESEKLNPRNRFILSLCDYTIAEEHLGVAEAEEDSLLKVSNLDSAFQYFDKASIHLKSCKRHVNIDYSLQSNKNRNKKEMLLKENKIHKAFIRNTVSMVLKQSRSMRGAANKFKGTAVKLRNRKSSIRGLRTEIPVRVSSRRSEELITAQMKTLRQKKIKSDSFSDLIEMHETTLEELLNNLSLNVWQKSLHQDSLIEPFAKSISYRSVMRDNYKKSIVEVRKKIPEYQKSYMLDISSTLFIPSDTAAYLTTEVIRCIDLKFLNDKEAYRLTLDLVKKGILPLSDLVVMKEQMLEKNRSYYCWFENNLQYLRSIYMGYDFLRAQQRSMEVIINFENGKEQIRLHKVEKELKRRKKKYSNIVSHNQSYMNKKKRSVKNIKRKYLKSLKEKY